MASSRGVGNFRSMFINIPNGNEKGIQLIPVGDIATKDEYEKIKNVTVQEVITGHRFPVEWPQSFQTVALVVTRLNLITFTVKTK